MAIEDIDAVTEIEVKAILSCLREGVEYQPRVARIMRTISESLHFVRYHRPADGHGHKYKNSTQLKRINLFVSREASRLIASTKKEFEGGTRLEHPRPLEHIYTDLAARRFALTSETLLELLGYYPLITVTAEEDRQLKHKGWSSPIDRYANANINVGRVKEIVFGVEPTWTPAALPELA